MLMEIAIIFGLLAVGYIAFDKLYMDKKKKEQNKIIRILLFEKIGDEKVFRGIQKGFEETDEKVGVYIMLKKIKKPISDVSYSEFFPDKDFGKCLMVCKYSDDDYRVISRMKHEEWFRKVALNPEDYYETQEVEDEETGEKSLEFKTDENGNPIPKKDDKGEPLPDFELQPYEEPLGVTQSAREAQRFNRDFTKRMQEKRKEAGGFWDKYGNLLINAFVILIMFMALAYMSNKFTDTQEKMSLRWADKADEVIKAQQSPMFVENLLKKIEQRDQEKEAPPK